MYIIFFACPGASGGILLPDGRARSTAYDHMASSFMRNFGMVSMENFERTRNLLIAWLMYWTGAFRFGQSKFQVNFSSLNDLFTNVLHNLYFQHLAFLFIIALKSYGT